MNLKPQKIGNTTISAPKITSTFKSGTIARPKMESKSQALKARISSVMPGRKSAVNNAQNPGPAHSMMMRATADKAKGVAKGPF